MIPSNPKKLSDIYGEKVIRPYQPHREEAITRLVEKVHKEAVRKTVGAPGIPPLPVGVHQAAKLPLIWVQIGSRYPWAVMWVRVVDGKKRKGVKKFTTLGGAIAFWAKVKRQVPTATIVSRVRGYDIPPQLRNRLPKGWFWCPHCMVPRKYQLNHERPPFEVEKKVWDPAKRQYKWVHRMVAVLECPMCENTNRDHVWRRSNQPWEVRKIKPGVNRVKRRRHR